MWKYEMVHNYLAAMKTAFSHVKAGGTIKMNWAGPVLNLFEFREEFVSALHRRINLKAGISDDAGYSDKVMRWRRDQRRLQDINNRIRVYQFETPEVRGRFGHLLANYEGR